MWARVSEVAVERLSIDAVVMGLTIGLGAILLDAWVGDAIWPLRIAALLLVGSALCAVQYLLLRQRRKK